MDEYIFVRNINKTGETGIVNIKTIKILCLCTEENARIILEALKKNSKHPDEIDLRDMDALKKKAENYGTW